jgi:hypothetical protein
MRVPTFMEALGDPEERPHLVALLNGGDDLEPRRRYARWLAARGDVRAEAVAIALRLPGVRDAAERAALVARLAAFEDEEHEWWMSLAVRQGRVANCGAAPDAGVRFSFRCPRSWERLEPTADPDVRRCDACRRDVFRCGTFAEAERHALAGDCISVPGRLLSAAHERYCKDVVGRPDAVEVWGRRIFHS